MRSILPIIALVAAACATGAREGGPRGGAAGRTEPAAAPAYAVRGADRLGGGWGWRAVLAGGVLTLDSPTSAGWYRLFVTERREGARRIVSGESLSLTIDEGGCRLAKLGHELPDRIKLEWDGGEFEACGGARQAPPADPLAIHWQLVRIGADAAPNGRSPAVVFSFAANGWVHGTQACNDTNAPIGWAGGRFVHRRDGGGTTDMGCGDDAAVMAFGRRFWTLMNHAKSWRIEGERLFIALPDGSIAELHYLL